MKGGMQVKSGMKEGYQVVCIQPLFTSPAYKLSPLFTGQTGGSQQCGYLQGEGRVLSQVKCEMKG